MRDFKFEIMPKKRKKKKYKHKEKKKRKKRKKKHTCFTQSKDTIQAWTNNPNKYFTVLLAKGYCLFQVIPLVTIWVTLSLRCCVTWPPNDLIVRCRNRSSFEFTEVRRRQTDLGRVVVFGVTSPTKCAGAECEEEGEGILFH